jgi:AraC-like DNA-binding protein
LIRFKYTLTSLHDLLELMSSQMKVPYADGVVDFPPEVAKGFMRVVQLPNGLEAVIGNLKLATAMQIERTRSNKEFYVFACDVASHAKGFVVDVDQERVEEEGNHIRAMYLLSFLSDLSQYAKAGTHFKTIRVVITRDWLAKYLNIEALDEVLQRYLSLKAGSVHVKEVDFQAQQLIEEILNPAEDSLMVNTYIQNRIMLLIENFFTWMYQQMSVMELKIRMNREEIEQMLKIEELLLSEMAKAPTISQLAREAAMSPSKLKKQFKDVFGQPIYEYYQKKRMQKARELLEEGNRSVKSVGIEMGFSNLSNFSLAFRKEFGELPSDVIKSLSLT